MGNRNFCISIFSMVLIFTIGCSGGGNKIDKGVREMAQKVKHGLDQYARDSNGIYPADLQEMVDAGYLTNLFEDHFKIPDFTRLNLVTSLLKGNLLIFR